MKLQKGTFFMAYIIYIFISVIYTFIIGESDIINTLIFSITIASTFFSIADCIFTKLEIEKQEFDEFFSIYFLTKYLQIVSINKMTIKYKEEVREKLINLKETLGDDSELEKIDLTNLSEKDQENYIKKINDPMLKKFFLDLIDTSKIFSEDTEDEQEIQKIQINTSQKQKQAFYIPSIFWGIGLVAMLGILTLRIVPYSKVNNIFTLIAFGAVILNLLFKECYKRMSLQQLADDKKRLIEDLKAELEYQEND